MSVIIKEVLTKKDLKIFIQFPFKIYQGNKYWVPPLIFDELKTLLKDKNPAFDFCEAKYWLAYKDNRLAGRIAGIINEKYIKIWKHKYARFGWVDFIDDAEVSKPFLTQWKIGLKKTAWKAFRGLSVLRILTKKACLLKALTSLAQWPVYIIILIM